jgi:hypothetical protein
MPNIERKIIQIIPAESWVSLHGDGENPYARLLKCQVICWALYDDGKASGLVDPADGGGARDACTISNFLRFELKPRTQF